MPLLEREAQLSRIGELVDAARSGAGGALLVEGPAGIGKTALLAAVDAPGFRILRGRGGELERDVAFGVARQLLGRVDELVDADPGVMLHRVFWRVADLADAAPLLLIVDDLHWADPASARLLAHLANRADALALLVLMASRTGEAPPLPSATPVLTLPPLSAAAVERLVGEPRLAAACAEVTGGNPYLLRELRAALPADAGPEALRSFAPRTLGRAVLRRLAALSPDAAAVARAVALLGQDADHDLAARIAGLDEERAAVAVDALVEADVLVAGRPLDFVHPLVRAAIREGLPRATAALEHRRAATLLHERAADVDRVAAHLLATEPRGDPWVVDRLVAAADEAAAGGAPDAALRSLQRALAEPPRPGVRPALLLRLGTVQASLADDAAVATLQAALEAGAPAARALARATHMRGDSLGAAQILEAADDPVLEADLLVLTQSSLVAREHLAGRLAAARDATEAAGPIAQAVVAVDLAHTDGTAEQAAALAEGVLTGDALRAGAGDVSVAFFLATVALALCDRLPAARTVLDGAIADAQRRGSRTDFQSALCLRSWVAHRQGDLLDAEADARSALDEAEAADILRPWKLANLANVLLERGGLAEARRLLADPAAAAYDHDSILYQPYRDAQGRVAALDGDADGAARHFADEDAWERRWGVRNPGWTQWRADEEGVRRAEAFGAPRPLGIALRRTGDLEGAADVLEHAGDRLELARTLRALGRRDGDRTQLREALDLADRCGATVLAAAARKDLHALGARPRRARLTGVESLTPQERRIAGLAAGGSTNRVIAETLFLTVRTVEMHLANAYRKLGAGGRSDLAKLFGPDGETLR